MVSLAGFGLSAAINGGIALLVLSIFLCLRRQPCHRYVYAPRLLHPVNRSGQPPPPTLPYSWFSWMGVVARMDHPTFLRLCGLDAYMFMRVLETCVVSFALMTVLGVGVLVPVNYTEPHGLATDPFDTIAMSNVNNNSPRLAAHILVAYCYTGIMLYMMYRVWIEYHQLRLAFLAREHLHNRRLTLVVTDIPTTVTGDAVFRQTFDLLYSDPLASDYASSMSAKKHSVVDSAYICKDVGKLEKWIADRDNALSSMEHAIVDYKRKPDERPKTATKFFCCAKKDALEHWTGEIERLNGEIQQKKPLVPLLTTGVGFITFDSVVDLQRARKRDHAEKYKWKCHTAPELRDMYWPSMHFTKAKRFYMAVIVSIVLYLLVAFWLIPVAFVQSIANLSNLSQSVPFLSWVGDIPPGALAVIDGFLPGLILTVFNIILPMILYKFAKVEGKLSLSQLAATVIDYYFIFQVFNNFIGTTVTTAVAQSPSELFTGGEAANVLGSSIPATANFFITYLLFQALTTYPLYLLNPGGVIVGYIKKKYLVKTCRDLVAVERAPAMDYGTIAPMALFIFVITVCFALLSSIILPFAVLFFSLAWFSHRYFFLYIYNTGFETGGRFWPLIARKMIYCMILAQVIFTLLLGLKQAPGPAVVSAPLIISPIVFMIVMEMWYKENSEALPVKVAQEIDRLRHGLVKKKKKKLSPSDDVVTRNMTADNIIFPHNLVTPFSTQRANDAAISEHESQSNSTLKEEKEQTILAVDSLHADQSAPQSSKQTGPEQSTTQAFPSSPSVLTPSTVQEITPEHSVGMLSGTSSRLHSRTGNIYQSSSSKLEQVEQVIAENRNNEDEITPCFDYIQPSLLAPDVLPIPTSTSVRMLDDPFKLSMDKDAIFEELWSNPDSSNGELSFVDGNNPVRKDVLAP